MTATPQEAANAFVAMLFLTLIALTIVVMGAFWLFGRVADHFGWFIEDMDDEEQVGTPAMPTLPVRSSTSDWWVTCVNATPEQAPHLVVAGPTGTGKTTLVTGLLHTRPGQIVIITAKTGDAWGGLPAVVIDDDGSFTTAAAVFAALLVDVKRRLVATKHQRDPGPWLTVVLDDYPALRDACAAADETFILIARLGRSLRVRLIVLSYSGLVKELGLEGKGESRDHFVWIRLDRQRRATLVWDEETHSLDTALVVTMAQRPLDVSRAWIAPTTPTTASERQISPYATATTTTPEKPVGAAQEEESSVVVVGKVTLSEQVAILSSALQMKLESGKFSRSEVCRRVFDGATGGSSYDKVRTVLDAAGL